MSKPDTHSAALPTAHFMLRLFVILNWIMGVAIVVLLVAMPNEEWIMSAFKLSPSPDTDRLIMGLRTVAMLGLVVVPLNYGVLKHLLAILKTVREGDPFVPMNALRLRTIAWIMLTLQVLGLVIGAIGDRISTPAHPVHLNAGFSTTGWLAVVLMFVLARVFAAGTLMRDDLQGTV